MLLEKLSPRVAGKQLRLPALLQLLLEYSVMPLRSPSPLPESRTSISRHTKTGRYLVFLNSEITNLGRDGKLDEARRVFDQMPFRDVVSWTAMLTAYADNGEVRKASEVFDEMPKRNTASWNAMISAYVHDLNLSEAFELFLRMPKKNVISYGAMMTGFAKSGLLREAEEVYKEMPMSWRDPVASNSLIYGYLRNGEVEEAARVFNGMMVKDVISWSLMVDGFCKNGRLLDAREIFEEMPVRNVISWTAMIQGYVKGGMWEDGLRMFSRMRREGMMINSTTLSVVLDACAEFGRGSEGTQIHGMILRKGFGSDVYLGNSIIVMYSRAGWMVSARAVFDDMQKKDVVSWNALITGYVQHDAIEEANALFVEMPEKDAVSWTTMVVGFSKRGWIKESVRLFEAMPEKDSVAWTAMVSCFAGNGEYNRAFQWFHRMLQEGVRPNPLVLSSVLSALSGLAILHQGVQVHSFIVKMELEFDGSIQSSLVSMYAKCGSLADAYRIFSNISEPNIIAINSMITGYAQHGLAKEALRLFKEVEANGCKPNHVTFLGILSACSGAGLVKEGYHYFKSMSSCYSIEPGPDHYTCMVDLLGRARLLKEALELIHSMPFDPNAAIWGALLNAGKMHFDLDIAKLAAQRLFELEPDNATAYTVLSNLYSSIGMKENEEELRMVQRTKGLKKSPELMILMELLTDALLCVIVFIVLLASLQLTVLALKRFSKGQLQLPPGPRRWPVVGNLLQLSHLPHRDLASFCTKYGPLVYLRLGSVDAITTDDPEVIREILLRQDETFASRPRTLAAVHLAYGCGDVALAPLGPHWKWMRRICMEHLLTTRRLETFSGHRTKEANHLVRQVFTRASSGEAVNVRQVLAAFSMNNVTRMLLGKQFFGEENAGREGAAEFMELTHELFWLLGLIYLGDYLPAWRWVDLLFGCEKKMREVERKVDEFHQKIIEEHRVARMEKEKVGGVAGDHGQLDFVDVLLSLPGQQGKERMEDVEIKALMQDMIAAATDTSSVTMEWALTEVIKNPRVLHKVQEELDSVVGRDRMVTESDLAQLTYLRCVVRETFRLHPAGPFLIPHESTRPTKLFGYDIPIGTRVFVNTHGLGRNTRIWDDVDKFIPERHLQEDGRRVEISHGLDFKILPFSAGKRKCPGAGLAVVMVLTGLARLFHCFDWAPVDGLRPEDIDTEEVYGMTMPKAQPLMAMAKPRLAPHLYSY
ncbi:hypothetical protein J5N97_017674 [Dioscorea zingiberensis]|uniref:Pentatricopeptide repeat-containing protein n=1 Tax=Dioscorea zingiberensis TaxID=325984 RepID=A0A9D5HGK6_9LILI|nr:hypothetical protein J5N97_017674 [Dioscorea zingiberensis]